MVCDLETGQHIERMVALQQLEKLRICMPMHISKLLKLITGLTQTMKNAIPRVKYALDYLVERPQAAETSE